MEKYICPVCAYDQLESKPYRNMPPISNAIYQLQPPYGQYWGMGSYEVCSCCGFEFGFDDDGIFPENNSAFQNYLQEWIERDNAKWFEPGLRPRDWDLEDQLSKAGIPPHSKLETRHSHSSNQSKATIDAEIKIRKRLNPTSNVPFLCSVFQSHCIQNEH